MKTKHATPILSIVQPTLKDEDVIDSLIWLLAEAVAGRITGLAYGALAPGKDFYFETAGEAHRDPLRTIGILQTLSQELTDRVRRRD